MNSSGSYKAMGQYRSVNAHGSVVAADKLQLVLLMMQGALDGIATAKGNLERGEVSAKGEQIGRAIQLIDGLRIVLDKDNGGEIAANLERLYEYAARRLLEANMSDSRKILDEIAGLLGEVKSAWEQIIRQADVIAVATEVAVPDGPAGNRT